MKRSSLRVGIASAAVAGASVLSLTGVAAASVHANTIVSQQKKLQQQLSARISQLGRLSQDVSSAHSLTTAHATLLQARLASASSSINSLSARVPTDKTQGELNADKSAMTVANRVYAVLTPQVFQTINADALTTQIAGMRANEPMLQADVNTLTGQNVYKTALSHYVSYVRYVNTAQRDVMQVANGVLGASAANYPKNAGVFSNANKKLLDAYQSLGHASYLQNFVGLEAGGYSGS